MTGLKRSMDVEKDDDNNNERSVNEKKNVDGVKERSLKTRELYDAMGHGVYSERPAENSNQSRIQAQYQISLYCKIGYKKTGVR